MEPKPFASLGATLLARKGGARPAMRPQLSPLVNGALAAGTFDGDLEDLGWNDMGLDDDEAVAHVLPLNLSPAEPGEEDEDEFESDIAYASLAPSAEPVEDHEDEEDEQEAFEPGLEAPVWEPPVFEQQPVFAEPADEEAALPAPAFEPEPLSPPAEPAVVRQRRELSATLRAESRPARRPASDNGRRAAFTLRLDADRHLKLRLASTLRNRSAQQLVTEALDRFLADIPDIEALAARMKRG